MPICADKWCIFRNPSPQLDLAGVEEAIRERMQRTGISDGIDILQIHWQDYSKPQVYLDAFRAVLELRRTRRLRLDVIGLVNFDTKRVIEICEAMGKGEILTNQIQVRFPAYILSVARVGSRIFCVLRFVFALLVILFALDFTGTVKANVSELAGLCVLFPPLDLLPVGLFLCLEPRTSAWGPRFIRYYRYKFRQIPYFSHLGW